MIRIILILSITFACNIISAQEPEKREKKNKFFGENSPFSEDDGVFISLHMGIDKDRMNTLGSDIDHIKFNSPTRPYLSAVVDFDLDEPHGIMFRMEIDYIPQYFFGKGFNKSRNVNEEYELKARTLNPCITILYKVLIGSKIRLYGGGGFGLRASKIKMYRHTMDAYTTYSNKNDFDLDESNWTLNCNVGLMLGKRYDLSCKLSRTGWSGMSEHNRILRNLPLTIAFGYRL